MDGRRDVTQYMTRGGHVWPPRQWSRGCESLLDGLANREHLGEPGDPEDLEYAFLAADELNRPIVLANPCQTADQHTEPGGVEELHSTDVDDDVVMTGVDEFEQRLPQ